MKVKNIRISIQPTKGALREFARTLRQARSGASPARRESVSFESLDSFRRAITNKRLELIQAIKKREPGSVYELAKMVGRDIKSVNDDLDVLNQVGLVSMEHILEERRRSRPKVVYDRIEVAIPL